jgi:hypothetical protein
LLKLSGLFCFCLSTFGSKDILFFWYNTQGGFYSPFFNIVV